MSKGSPLSESFLAVNEIRVASLVYIWVLWAGHRHPVSWACGRLALTTKLEAWNIQQIAVILQHGIQNSKTKIYIASFQMTLELGYLKGGYVNFGFAVWDFLLQEYCVTFTSCVHLSSGHSLLLMTGLQYNIHNRCSISSFASCGIILHNNVPWP